MSPSDPNAAFQGSIPAAYEQYMVPLFFEPYAADLARRAAAAAPRAVLETACGTGAVTEKLRASLPPSTSILATDLNDAMLERARLRLARMQRAAGAGRHRPGAGHREPGAPAGAGRGPGPIPDAAVGFGHHREETCLTQRSPGRMAEPSPGGDSGRARQVKVARPIPTAEHGYMADQLTRKNAVARAVQWS